MSHAEDFRPVVVVLPGADGRIDADRMDAARSMLDGDWLAPRNAEPPDGIESVDSPASDWPGLITAAARRAGDRRPILLIRDDLILPAALARRLRHLVDCDPAPPLIQFAGNFAAELDPTAGLDTGDDAAAIDSALWNGGRRSLTPIDYRPRDCALIPPGARREAETAWQQGRCWLYDGLFLADPKAARHDEETLNPAAAAALGPARLTLDTLAAESPAMPLPLFGADGKPVTLHIAHDWGGGVARWIRDLHAADREHNHLVLSAAGRTDGTVHGQWLKLYAAGPGHGLIKRWTLTPAIASTTPDHAQYRAVLEWICNHHAVSRVLVSSLIGHSLDALATGRPSAQMLHDYYPAWPLLDHDPANWPDGNDGIDLDAALAEHGDSLLFGEHDAAFWRQLGDDWLAAVNRHDVRLAAPGEQVIERWRRLAGKELDSVECIPHGFAGWPDQPPAIERQATADGRLHLVVIGRLGPGKGLDLLDRALDSLQPLAHITLVGCGHHGMRLFGRAGVDMIIDYRHEELPALLAALRPQAALFLSTVAETWNYVLSETRSLGLVPLATATGSFVERIRDGHDGRLFEAGAENLIRAVSELADHPGKLDQWAARLPREAGMKEALSRLAAWLPGATAEVPPASVIEPGPEPAGRIDSELAAQRARLRRRQQQLDALRTDLDERTDWARRQERFARQRTQWAWQLDEELEERTAELHESESRRRALQEKARQLDEVTRSLSWRLTRPLRVARRLLANTPRRTLFNPLRWPRAAGGVIAQIRLRGLRETIEMLQSPELARAPAPVTRPVATPEYDRPRRPVRFPAVDRPQASIVIPVYDKVEYTDACLNSIAEHGARCPFEVIVVDDCSGDETADYLSRCDGITVLRNETNAGFIRSCNRGAAAARGEWLVFVNNDTTLTAGWLDALLASFDHFPDAGIAGARLVFPDGRLQEAGGIVFNDGSGWNYGRGDNADRPEYNFAAPADYVSGACLAIARERFLSMGGFDDHYLPAYYEDTDLCFRVRQAGLEVIYQPVCTVIHHEGVTSGTDEGAGIKQYQAVNRQKFIARWGKVLAGHPDPVPGPEAVERIRRARHRGRRDHVLVIDATTPQPDHDSGSVRLLALLELLRESGHQVSFLPQNLAWTEPYSRDLQARGIQVLHHPWVRRPEDWLNRHGGEISTVIVSRHYVLAPWLKMLNRLCPRARLIFDTVDLHFLREQRQAELTGDQSLLRTAARTRESELALMKAADISLVVSPHEKELLAEWLPRADIRVLSNIHTVHGRATGWQARRDMMFVGGFQHPPNQDAAAWLIDEIFPRIRRQLPEAQLHLIGSRMPEALRRRAGDGVVIHGFVADLDPWLRRCRLSLAPLRYGAGVKGKVNQAMAHGLPVVATSCGAEGMYLVDGADVLIADSAEDFAAAVVRAYNDESLWLRLSDGGLANVERHFSRDAARCIINKLVERDKTG